MIKHPRRLTNFFLPDTGQMAFVVLFAIMGAILSASSILVYVSMQDLIRRDGAVSVDSMYDNEEDYSGELAVTEWDNASLLEVPDSTGSLFQIGLIALSNFFILLGFSLVLSHRLFGPIYRLRIFIDDLQSGSYEKRLTLRGYDSFQVLATALNGLAEKLATKQGTQK